MKINNSVNELSLGNKILVLGYSDKMAGGIVNVTKNLTEHIPEIELHPILFGYGSIYISLFKTIFSYCRFLWKLISNRGICIVQIIVGSTGDAIRTIPFILTVKFLRRSVVLHYHKSTDKVIDKLPQIVRIMLRLIWNNVDQQIFLSKNLQVIHFNNGFNINNSTIIKNSLPEIWLKNKPLEYKKRNLDIIFIGRWSWEKGVQDILKAMSKMDLDVELHCFTNVPDEISHKKIRFYKWVKEEEVIDIIRHSKVLLLPSYSEAYPTVLLEAAACGTPFVATNIAGIPDIAQESEGGLLIEEGDIDSMIGNLKKLLLDQNTWQEKSFSAFEWSKCLSIDNIKKDWYSLYNSLK